MYERITLYGKPSIEVVIIKWKPGDKTVKHNHGKSTGIVEVIKGTVFEIRNGKKRFYHVGDRLTVKGTTVHIMGNDSKYPAITVHVYTPRL